MKIIGSRQAARLAAQKFGLDAHASRSGKWFFICTVEERTVYHFLLFRCTKELSITIKGRGKSWEAALKDAGISIPEVATSEETDRLIRDSMDDLYPEFKDKKEKK